MASAAELLSELRTLDIRLSVEGDRLRCNAPRGHLTPELEERIATHKQELLAELRASSSPPLTIPQRSASTASIPLSFAQERFWFLQNFDPDSTDYNITTFQRMTEPVDAVALESAIASLADRHEILRTTFPEVDGAPVQHIQEDLTTELAIFDFSHLAPAEQQPALEDVLRRQARHRFALASEPAFRVALVRNGPQDQIIVLTIHHILCDAWSLGIFFNELQSTYKAVVSGRPPQSSPLPVQYGDYALWERERDAFGVLAPQLKYWKRKLQGAPPYLDIPVDRPRARPAVFEPKAQVFNLGPATSESLRILARQESATPFMTLLTVFSALLSRYASQSDVVIGTPVSTRAYSELEPLIGCFINTHALRTEIPAGSTAREILARVRTTVIESLANADIPFETVVSEVVTERDLSRSPLFQTAFILQNTPLSSAFNVVSGGTTFDITLYMWEAEGAFGGCFEYNSQLFEPDTIACLADSFRTLAAEMAQQPDAATQQLSLLSPAQEAKWFEKENGARATYPAITAHEWIERQAASTPEAIAVVCGREKLTFQQLSLRSNRLAHRLRAQGVGPNSLVAICLNRSIDLAVAPLAVWKAGAAYIPLDPEYPAQRIAFMLEDSAVSVLLTESQFLEKLPSSPDSTICLDLDAESIEQESAVLPGGAPDPADRAYVIYTSGSTGKPKGVEITHRSLVNFLASMQHQPGITASDRLLAVTTFSFDIAGLELYLPLVTGAEIVIAPRDAVFDGSALAQLLREAGVTIMQATPVTWRLLLESGWKGTPGLKILCGGEALPQELANQLLATGADLWNLYGPTETTIWSTLQHLDSGHARVTVGRPIANTDVHVLDEYGHPVPRGVPGELYIGGDGLARGYLGRDELTSERFIHSQFHEGKRLYRTGDLVRRSPAGTLDYLSRIDNQVKIRGFRIEPGEIETAIEQQPYIAHAVVVVREDQPGDQRLVAYFTIEDRTAPHAGALRKALLGLLPDYMIPSAFIPVDQFPLTPNRKVDRKALLGPEYRPDMGNNPAASDLGEGAANDLQEQNEEAQSSTWLPPRNHVELVMTEIWRDVLGVEKVGVQDNFFELGGHSLAAARLIARLRSALSMELPLRCIFIDPTIAGLASHIAYDPAVHGYRYTTEIPGWNCLVPAQPRGTRTPLFFVGGYQSPDDTLLVLSQLIPNLGMDQPVFGFRPRWVEGNGEDYASVEEMAQEFVQELRAVQPEGPYMLGGHCVGGIAALEVARLLMQQREEVGLMVFLDTERPSRMRTFFTDLYFLRKRLSHIVQVLSGIIHPGERSRGQIVRDLTRRKLKIAPSQRSLEDDRFYQSKVRYRRLLYAHKAERYPGAITLIVNQEQARRDHTLGWSRRNCEQLRVLRVEGDHTTILTQHGKQVAQVILQCIDEAAATSGPLENLSEVEAV